jgi:LPXTG-motif cell wall-anchored protein
MYNHARRGPLTTLGLGIGMALLATTVLAPDAAATDYGDGHPVPIAAGSAGLDVVGHASFVIVPSDDEGGPEALLVQLDITTDGGFLEAHLCLSETEYTGRTAHGLCPWKVEGPDGVFPLIDISGYEAGPHAQLHVKLADDVGAFAGHRQADRGPFYGNVDVREVAIPQPSSTGVEGPSSSNDDDPDDEGQGVGTGGGDVTGDQPPAGPSGPVDPAPQAGSPQVPETPVVGEADLPPLPSPPRSAPVPVEAPVPGDGVTLIDPVSLDRLAEPPAAPVVPAAAGERPTEVLGIQLERAAGTPSVAGQSLPRTGADTPVLIWSAVGLLLAGAGLLLLGGRAAGRVAAP